MISSLMKELHGDEIRPDLPRESLRLGLEGLEIIPHIQKNLEELQMPYQLQSSLWMDLFSYFLGTCCCWRNTWSAPFGPSYASNASSELVAMFSRTGLPVVGACPVGREEISNYGVVEISDEKVKSIVEKPDIESALERIRTMWQIHFPRKYRGNTGNVPPFRVRRVAIY